MRYSLLSAGAVAIATSVLSTAAAHAASFTFTKVVDSDTSVFGKTLTFGSLAPSLDGDTVAFTGNFGTPSTPLQGIYTSTNGSLTRIVESVPFVSGLTDQFIRVSNASLDGNTVAFRGTFFGGGNDEDSIYAGSGGATSRVAPIDLEITSLGSLSIDNSIVAYATSTPQLLRTGVFLAKDATSAEVVADPGTPSPDGNFFRNFFGVTLDNGNVAFSADTRSEFQIDPIGSGIYTNVSGAIATVADTSTLIPGSSSLFTLFGLPDLSGSAVAFTGGTPGSLGVYLSQGGGLTTIADTTTLIPGTNVPFAQLGSGITSQVSVSGNQVAFVGTGLGTAGPVGGLFLGTGSALTKVIGIDEQLDGKDINSLTIGSEALDTNALAFLVGFTDGSQAIYRADIAEEAIPEPASILGALSAIGLGFGCRKKYRQSAN